MNKKFETPYSIAWKEFTKRTAYQEMRDEMLKHGMKQPYVDNIIKNAFDEGWSRNLSVRKNKNNSIKP